MISADVKANKNNKKIKDLALSYKILKDLKIWNTNLKYLQNLKYSMKGASIFHLILVGILSILIVRYALRTGGRDFCLTDKIR